MDERQLRLHDGRTIRYFDSGTGSASDAALTVVWHHGTPQTGRLIAPLMSAATARGIRLVSCARPSYPGSSPLPGRSVADATADVIAVADSLGIDSFATAGASGGGPHALACAALAPERVSAVMTLAGIAPFTEDFDWFAGMASDGGLRAARVGRDERAHYAETAEFDEASFTASDWQALSGEWGALGEDAGLGSADGPGGEIDDDVAYVSDWGVGLADIRVPVLLVQGGEDRVVPAAHAAWMLPQLAHGELWSRPHDGHISVLRALPVGFDWLLASISSAAG